MRPAHNTSHKAGSDHQRRPHNGSFLRNAHREGGVNQQAVKTVTHDAIPSPPFPALDDKSPARECGERNGQILSRRHFKGDR